ncbi:MAG TPA: DoxX family protein [Candidatus Limnocylindria bacterium]|nr:DoxX family protein [Candidatus Limnocylindria bacterium]
MASLGLLLLRSVTGFFLMGHGAQKLLGAFGGRGIEGTAAYFEGLGIKPGRPWARVAGTSEMAGGALTALGLFFPLGPVISIAPMVVAWRRGHGDKPIWVNKGGAELPATNVTIACALILTGPGALSLDRLLGVRVPWWLSLLAMAATAGGIVVALDKEIHELAEETRPEAREHRAERTEAVSSPT